MSALRDRIINGIIEREGDYVDNPDDSGGPTRWGITEREARANGYTGAMQALPRYLTYNVYRDEVDHDLLRADWKTEAKDD